MDNNKFLNLSNNQVIEIKNDLIKMINSLIYRNVDEVILNGIQKTFSDLARLTYEESPKKHIECFSDEWTCDNGIYKHKFGRYPDYAK